MIADRSPRPRRLAVATGVVALALALAGCVDAAVDPTPAPTQTAEPTPTATPTVAPSDGPAPLAITCDELLPAQVVYDFSPTLALVGAWEPTAGSPAADDLAAGGTLCQWVAESGGTTVDVSVARYSPDRITELKNAAFTESQMVPTYGAEGYFEVEGGSGVAIVFPGDIRLTIASAQFAEPGEATPLVEAALAALAGR